LLCVPSLDIELHLELDIYRQSSLQVHHFVLNLKDSKFISQILLLSTSIKFQGKTSIKIYPDCATILPLKSSKFDHEDIMPLAYTIISGLSVVLVFASFRSHWRTENYAACILIIWVAVNNLFYCINSIIWPDFETIHEKWDGRIYCDIMSRISICVNAGVLGSLAAISRNLAKIISDRSTAAFSRSEKRKNLAIDLALCFALPIWYNLVYYFVQYARYWLIPVSGCVAVLDSSWLATILIFVPGLIMTLTTLYFSCKYIL